MFDHLKKYDMADAMSWMPMRELGPQAQLLLKPATEANKPYYNAVLKRAGKRARQLAAGGGLSADDLAESRREDRELFPKFVLAGWKGVLDENGEEITFSRDHATELCQKLPPHLFDRVRAHCNTPERFYPEDEELPPDPQELAGNSEDVSAGN